MYSMKFALLISSSPSARMIRFTGISSTSRIVFQVKRWFASAPFEFVEPRAMMALPTPGRSRISAAKGGACHAFKSPTGWTSYISYTIRVTGAPTSSSPMTSGWPPFDQVRVLQPISAIICRTSSEHSRIPSPVALTEGWRSRRRVYSSASGKRASRARSTSGGASPAMARGNGDRPIRFSVSRGAATFLGPPAIANPMLRIEADVLIPGLGDPIKDGALVVDGATIAYAGPIEGAPSAAGATTLNVPALMPGMWDVHGHFMGIRTLNVEEIARTPLPVLAARATKDAEVAVSAGFTSIRELSGLGVHLARVVAEGTIRGPHIYGAGGALSQTGGHGDLHSFPLDFMHEVSRRTGFSYLCDGVPECLKGVRMQLRVGARVIKVLASGGVASELDHPVHAQFSRAVLEAIVAEAARADRVVAAHCHGKPGIMAALRAGCRTIEHGTFLDEEAADLLLQRDAILVPTRFIIDRLVRVGKEGGIAEYAYRKAVAISEQHQKALRIAIRKGGRMATGADIFTSAGGPAGWGPNGPEGGHPVQAGMKPLPGTEAATATGPLTLGPQGPKSGQLQAGYDADFLALAKNPLDRIGVLAEPEHVRKVWIGGELVKDLPI